MTGTTAPPAPAATGGLSSTFEFDAAFQTKIAALVVRDVDFVGRTEGLITPECFEDAGEGVLVNIVLEHFASYRVIPDRVVLVKEMNERHAAKRIPAAIWDDVKLAFVRVLKADISDKEYVIDQVAVFARHQATAKAILDSVILLDKRDFGAIEKQMREALDVGKNLDINAYDYFARIDARSLRRREELAGLIKPNGIPTGLSQLDNLLYHKGYGRKELTVYMGGAKSGKTTALIDASKCAALQGFNVLYVTLEVSKDIISDRADASTAGFMMKELKDRINDIESKIRDVGSRAGKWIIHEFPTGSLRPRELRRLIQYHEQRGVKFDMVVVDYADLMTPDYRTDDAIENSKSIYVGLRGLATEFNIAMLTATQTNRDGYKASVSKAEHVAEDFNKVRIADLLISINATDDERAKGEVRLYFAASRNQQGGFSVRLKVDIEKMRFFMKVLGVET